MNEKAWMSLALAQAEKAASEGEVPMGAILVHGNQILSLGRNRREHQKRTTAHAEIVALELYNHLYQTWRLPEDTSLYVTTEPCLMCTGALLNARLTHVYFGCLDPKSAGLTLIKNEIDTGKFDHKFASIHPGIEEEKSRELLQKFFKERRETKRRDRQERSLQGSFSEYALGF